MKHFLVILSLILSACSSSHVDLPFDPPSNFRKNILLLDVVDLEHEIGFEGLMPSQDAHKLTNRVFDWKKRTFKCVGTSNHAKLTIDRADLTFTQGDQGSTAKAFVDIRLGIYSPQKKKLTEVSVSGEKSFTTQAKLSPALKEELLRVLINQLIFSLNESFEKKLTEDLSQYVFIDHSHSQVN